ncbi:hypothetical protein MCI_00360 [Rickettsia montanensis str. OSU 85-930]|uniref:Uncharacterized protein n=1 Tax=Rickettsia montanensis (strain OSU 85-930) TaxID=1105114 RepID=H8KAA3_RICMS|nr:hypothetical protein MCI_00360 [Rickettsia montanensis str. OSU 85-930]
MLSTDKNCLKFFNEKGNDIANYITEILPSDYIKAFEIYYKNLKVMTYMQKL